jgi:hypothetical protein
MTDCDDFQVAIEKRLHGVPTDPVEPSALEEHLRGCASCRDFARLAERTETTMTNDNLTQLGAVDLEALGARIHAALWKNYRHALWRAGAAVLLMLPIYAALTRSVAEVLVFLGVVALAVGVRAPLRVWLVMRHKDDRGELLYHYRRELDRRLRVATFSIFVPVLFGALVGYGVIRNASFDARRVSLLMALFAVSLGLAAYSFFVRRPTLQREIAQLKR